MAKQYKQFMRVISILAVLLGIWRLLSRGLFSILYVNDAIHHFGILITMGELLLNVTLPTVLLIGAFFLFQSNKVGMYFIVSFLALDFVITASGILYSLFRVPTEPIPPDAVLVRVNMMPAYLFLALELFLIFLLPILWKQYTLHADNLEALVQNS